MKKGFTMLEILTSLIIIAALAAVLVPRFATTKAKINQRQAESYLRAVRMAQKMFYARNGLYACSTACANASAIQTGLGAGSIDIKDGAYVYSMTASDATHFTATATGGSANLTINQDGAWTKGGSAYTPP